MGKVNSGDPLKIRATEWNLLLDMADPAKPSAVSPGGLPSLQRGFMAAVKNNTGAAVARYHAVGIGAPLFSPADSAGTFQNQLGFVGEDMAATYLGKFAVMQEQADNGKIGRAMLEGITCAEITVNHADHDRVDVDTAGGSKLVSQFYGAGEILYKESGTGTKWAIIRIGAFVSEKLKAIAAADIAVNSSGNVAIQRAGSASQTVTAYLNWMEGSTGITSGDELFIRFYRDENKYVVEGAEC
ncbi:MAG: hypothetical protein ACYC4U_11430 [Pirellulaceae bacterium]